jgi:GDPmannose 4,6-dehydratase
VIPRTIIVGCAGQDGKLLAERFLREDRPLLGISRTSLDILDPFLVASTVRWFAPDEVYYLAAHHHSAQDPAVNQALELYERSHETHIRGLLHFLEALRVHRPQARLFYAGSSHLFGDAPAPQSEQTPFNPTGIYGITKLAGVNLCRFYRRTHGLFAAVGILYNHESALRRTDFVSQKIVRAAVAIAKRRESKLVLGDLGAVVDWGYAVDYVDAMVRMLGLPEPEDLVIATGEGHTVEEFVSIAFSRMKLDWRQHVQVEPGLVNKPRATLVGNPARLNALTGWKPSVTFGQMIHILINAELLRLRG